MTPDLLRTVVAAARRSAWEREQSEAGRAMSRLPSRRSGAGRFRAALGAPGVRVIAECKRRSPSRGVLQRHYDPAVVGRAYESAGAAAISVLTEPTFFDGTLDHLNAVAEAVHVPVMRKDFIVTEHQIVEAERLGADAVLLIVAALSSDELRGLLRCADREGVAALVEVHDLSELERGLEAGADIIGVNSRNLRTLDVDPGVFETLAPRLPAGVLAVAESGLRTADDLGRLAALRYDAFLVGERLMTADRPGAALAELLQAAGSVMQE